MPTHRRARTDLADIARDAAGNRRSHAVEKVEPTRAPRPEPRKKTQRPAWSRGGRDRTRVSAARRALVVPPPPRRRAWPWVLLGLLLVILAAHALRPAEPDPHFLRAQQLLEEHELGRAPETLNYGDPVYVEMLDELRRVAPDSISAGPAQDLATEIGRAVDAFRAERQAGRSREEAIAAGRRGRARDFEAAQAISEALARSSAEHED